MTGFRLFTRTNSQYFWNLASYHSPHSLTWRWLVSFSLFCGDEARVRPLWWSYRDNNGIQWGFRVPWVGIVRFAQQRPMWFRDLWRRASEENESLKQLTRTASPRPPLRSPFKPTIIDGGQSYH